MNACLLRCGAEQVEYESILFVSVYRSIKAAASMSHSLEARLSASRINLSAVQVWTDGLR